MVIKAIIYQQCTRGILSVSPTYIKCEDNEFLELCDNGVMQLALKLWFM
jgi:hypothetical protein